MESRNIVRSKLPRPYFLSTADQLPQSLLEQTGNGLLDNQVIEGIFVVPPETYSMGIRPHYNPLQALIFAQQGVLHIVASPKGKQPAQGVWVAAEDIVLIRLSLILLYGKLEICGVQNGKDIRIEVEYNTVAHNLLDPVFDPPF